jgi:hypothetical protein
MSRTQELLLPLCTFQFVDEKDPTHELGFEPEDATQTSAITPESRRSRERYRIWPGRTRGSRRAR